LDANEDGTIHPDEIISANMDEQRLINSIDSVKYSNDQHAEL
jgi:hypothetical protein